MSHTVPGVSWHRPHRFTVDDLPMDLAPQLRGHVTPAILDALEARGYTVHRIGRAAYVHGAGQHLILGSWPGSVSPARLTAKLGQASAGYRRRIERKGSEQAWRRQARDARGRFGTIRAWHHWPTPEVYSFEPSRPSPTDLARERTLDHNHAVRVRAGLEAIPECELRALWGDR